ncbi:metal binding domain of Ada-domain-containing protein [Astrocystis sublimbata]|nr:metal binding domain of Ada-domain-containing protein [Astrocystis sublimbata]
MMSQNQSVVAIPRHKRTEPACSSSSPADEARWRLVLAHTPTTEFLYAVLSTGIYCRTSCPSRRPRRSNVRFFESAASAVAAGFRACRRCRPESTDSSLESPRASAEKQVNAACDYVRRRKGEVQLVDLAAHVGLSPRYFHGLFKQVIGSTPGAYALAVRRENAEQTTSPATTDASLSDSAPHIVGLRDPAGQMDPSLLDDILGGVSFVDSDQAACNWLLEGPGGLDGFDFNQAFIPDWMINFDCDMTGLSQMDNESFETQLNNYAPVYMDPSLLNP